MPGQPRRRDRRLKTAIAVAGAAVIPLLSSSAHATGSTWTQTGSSAWSTTGNWNNGVPNSTGAIATFATTGTGWTATVSGQTVGTLEFENASGSHFQDETLGTAPSRWQSLPAPDD